MREELLKRLATKQKSKTKTERSTRKAVKSTENKENEHTNTLPTSHKASKVTTDDDLDTMDDLIKKCKEFSQKIKSMVAEEVN
jgi:hypothetical protein